jgi:hypothetical protein
MVFQDRGRAEDAEERLGGGPGKGLALFDLGLKRSPHSRTIAVITCIGKSAAL